MENSIRILFWLYKSKANRKGLAPLFMRLTVNGTKTEISTGLQLSAKTWNVNTGYLRGASNEAKEMNKRIDLLKAAALKEYNAMLEQQLIITAPLLKDRLNRKDEPEMTLLKAFEYHNNLMSQKIGCEVAAATVKKYEIAKNKVQHFLQQSGRSDISLKVLKHSFVMEFETYLKTTEMLSHNTAIKMIQLLKKVVHLCIANEWLTSDPFKSFKCSLINKDRGYLTHAELKNIESRPINSPRLNFVRELFLFACYTGLSYADIKQLACRHIETRQDGKRWIVLHRQKTGVRSAIPLLPMALKILDRYEPPFLPDNDWPIFRVISNQKMNEYLKEVAQHCSIDKRLTFHLARHTFATTVTLSRGVDIASISKMLGHTSIKTTEQYSKVVDSKVEDDMRALELKICA